MSTINLLLDYLTYQNNGKKLKMYTYYDVSARHKFETKTQLVRGETKITNLVKA